MQILHPFSIQIIKGTTYTSDEPVSYAVFLQTNILCILQLMWSG